MINIAVNEGKRFEQNWKNSCEKYPNIWIYRLKDNAASFGGGNNTRFASHNMCDYIMFEDDTRTLYAIECKSTKNTSVPLSMIRQNQIDELSDAGKHNLVAGFLINFRNKNNDTYFIEIRDFNQMLLTLNKKSFNIKDLERNNAIYVDSECKKVNHVYEVKKFISETHQFLSQYPLLMTRYLLHRDTMMVVEKLKFLIQKLQKLSLLISNKELQFLV